MNIFDTRTMIGAIKEGELKTSSFLRDRYFANHKTFDTARIDVDIIGKGNRKVAPFVHPRIGGKVIEREGYQTNSYEAPEISPMRVTTAEDMLKRAPGETIYGEKGPEERAAEQLGQDLAELDEKITRKEEVMCADALFSGQITVNGDGYNGEVINYWPAAAGDKPYTKVATSWDAAAVTAKAILKEIRNIRRAMIKESGITPTEMVCGTKVIDAILDKLVDAGALDTRRVDMGHINPQYLPNGVTYWGHLKDSALDLYSYDEWYVNDQGQEVALIPEGKILMASPNAKTTLAYGVVSLLDEKADTMRFYEGERIPDSYISRKNPSGRVVQIKSRPLPIVHQVQAFHVIEAVYTA